MRLFPDEASAWFKPQELAFAREVERLGADPKLADDPGRLIDLATETPDLRYFRHAYLLVDGGAIPRAGRGAAGFGAALGAMTRKPGGPGKGAPSRDPRIPPLGDPRTFPKELTDRLDHIKTPKVRGAVERILQGSTPDKLNRPPLEKDFVAYEPGGHFAGMRDYWRAVRNTGGDWTKIDTREPGVIKYAAADGTRITFRRQSANNAPTNEIHVEWGAKGPARLKVRYE